MRPYLLLDFGTTSTKSALVDPDTGTFWQPRSHPSIAGADGPPGHHEIPLPAIRDRFHSICSRWYDEPGMSFQGILVCSEMHGFAVLDGDDRPLTHYIGWKDERSLEALDGITTFDQVSAQLGDTFRRVTGMKPRPGFPLLNLIHLGRTGRLPPDGQVVSLPGWLARCSGDALRLEHPTILAGMTFYDVRRDAISTQLLELVRESTGFACTLAVPAPAGQVAGYWHRNGEKIPLYIGVGDHQCSVLGAGLTPGDFLSINLGTGSQVSVLDAGAGNEDDGDAEIRPYFDGHRLRTITHVPAGRALSEYIGFLDEVAGGKADFWTLLGKLTADEILASDMDFELDIFPGARRFAGGGRIARVREGRLTLHNYLASLLRSFAGQYREVIASLDPGSRLRRCLLSGGIARNLPVLPELIARDTGLETFPATPLDESLLGLRALSLVAAGRVSSCLEGQQVFGRECRTRNG